VSWVGGFAECTGNGVKRKGWLRNETDRELKR